VSDRLANALAASAILAAALGVATLSWRGVAVAAPAWLFAWALDRR
jgi:hypothetical protein